MDITVKYILEHIDRVRKKLNKLIKELTKRANDHDASKLREPELTYWRQMDQEKRYDYGTPEYERKIKKYEFLMEMHYKANRHHPEHFHNGISDMTLVDLTEMLCDWLSYKEKMRVSEAIKLIEDQSKRFHYSEEIKNMLINTCLEYFTIFEGLDDTEEKEYNPYKPPESEYHHVNIEI